MLPLPWCPVCLCNHPKKFWPYDKSQMILVNHSVMNFDHGQKITMVNYHGRQWSNCQLSFDTTVFDGRPWPVSLTMVDHGRPRF